MTGLFPDDTPKESSDQDRPLAERMRPTTLEEFVGQHRLLGQDSSLRASIEGGDLPSLVLWGPPGCGKTTLAACLAQAVGATLLSYSAVRVGVKELRQAMAEAAKFRAAGGRPPILFLDEIHRFNKGQQDALLPAVEAGDIVLIGATTENPSFEVNAALLSRCRVLVLESLTEEDLIQILDRALESERGLATSGVRAEPEALRLCAERCGGDARFALNSLELAVRLALQRGLREASPPILQTADVDRVLTEVHLHYDKGGEEHFNLISALHKSLRNSDAQAGVYWLVRMLESGEDPLYVARRLVRFASEDVGMADPHALQQAVAASLAVERIGLPEGALALVQAAVYLAQAPKSNAIYLAHRAVREALDQGFRDPVPLSLRNATTSLMKDIGYGEGYRYAHDEEDGVARMDCLPERLRDRIFYHPTDRGFEAEAGDRLREAWRRSHGRSSRPNPSQEE